MALSVSSLTVQCQMSYVGRCSLGFRRFPWHLAKRCSCSKPAIPSCLYDVGISLRSQLQETPDENVLSRGCQQRKHNFNHGSCFVSTPFRKFGSTPSTSDGHLIHFRAYLFELFNLMLKPTYGHKSKGNPKENEANKTHFVLGTESSSGTRGEVIDETNCIHFQGHCGAWLLEPQKLR